MSRTSPITLRRRLVATTLTLASIVGPSAFTGPVLAQQPAPATAAQTDSGWSDEEIVRRIGLHGSATTFAAVAIDVDRLDPASFAAAIRRVTDLTEEESGQIDMALAQAKSTFDAAGIREIVFLADVHPVRMVSSVAILRIDDKTDILATTELVKSARIQGLDEARFIDGALVMKSSKDADEGPAAPPFADLTSVREALAAGGDAPIRAAVFFSPDLRRVIGELAFTLGDEQAVSGAKLLAKELQFASLAFDPAAQSGRSPAGTVTLDLILKFKTIEGATSGEKLATAAIARLRKELPAMEQLPFSERTLDDIAKWLTPERSPEGNELALRRSLDDPTTEALFREVVAPALVEMRGQAARMTNMNKFKQIAIAFHNFHDTYRHLPLAGNQKKDGNAPGLSWRVHLLPFLEQDALYKKFKLDEAWDSSNNKALIAEMPDLYKLDPSVPNGKTVALLPMGEGYTFSGEEPATFADITDGTSNTLWVVQAAPEEAVTWTKPEDLNVDLTEIADQLGAEGEPVFLSLRGDGSVSAIRDTLDPQILHALFTRAGGEVIDENAVHAPQAEMPAPAEDPTAEMTDIDKFKQIALAFHNFADVNGHMPPAGSQKQEGKASGLSWRVHLLPFLEQQALYQQFKLDEPWDSENNRKLIAKMPAIYNLDPMVPQGQTVVQLPLGEGFGFSGDEPTTFVQITDGTSNTILAVRAASSKAVIWTKPDDLQLDPSQAATQLGADRASDFLALMFDGSVRKVAKVLNVDTLKAALTRAGGEPVTLP